MQIVVDIEDSVYHQIKQHGEISEFHKLIIHGIPLPKGHGRIVDIGSYEGKVIASRKYCGVNRLVEIAELDTIIEADKTESEG